MFRWVDVDEQTITGLTVKMYREPLIYEQTQPVKNDNLELDHYAYKYLGSETLAYQILETNFTEFIEGRGDTNRIKNFVIPIEIKEEVLL